MILLKLYSDNMNAIEEARKTCDENLWNRIYRKIDCIRIDYC